MRFEHMTAVQQRRFRKSMEYFRKNREIYTRRIKKVFEECKQALLAAGDRPQSDMIWKSQFQEQSPVEVNYFSPDAPSNPAFEGRHHTEILDDPFCPCKRCVKHLMNKNNYNDQSDRRPKSPISDEDNVFSSSEAKSTVVDSMNGDASISSNDEETEYPCYNQSLVSGAKSPAMCSYNSPLICEYNYGELWEKKSCASNDEYVCYPSAESNECPMYYSKLELDANSTSFSYNVLQCDEYGYYNYCEGLPALSTPWSGLEPPGMMPMIQHKPDSPGMKFDEMKHPGHPVPYPDISHLVVSDPSFVMAYDGGMVCPSAPVFLPQQY